MPDTSIAKEKLMTCRRALKIARDRARLARQRGEIFSAEFELKDGRTLIVYHAPAYGEGQLFGVWRYSYDHGMTSRELSL
jgi:hypothetical protein